MANNDSFLWLNNSDVEYSTLEYYISTYSMVLTYFSHHAPLHFTEEYAACQGAKRVLSLQDKASTARSAEWFV
jgi:hypothetical protein